MDIDELEKDPEQEEDDNKDNKAKKRVDQGQDLHQKSKDLKKLTKELKKKKSLRGTTGGAGTGGATEAGTAAELGGAAVAGGAEAGAAAGGAEALAALGGAALAVEGGEAVVAAGVGGGAALGIGGAVIVVILLLIIVVAAVLVILFGGGNAKGANCTTKTVTSTDSSNPGSNPPTMDEFLKMFKVESCPVSGYGSNSGCVVLGPSSPKTQWIYKVLSVPLSSPKYKKLLTGDGLIYLRIRPKPHSCGPTVLPPGGTCGGAGYGPNVIEMGGYYEARNNLYVSVSVVHESGHLIQNRNSSVLIGGSDAMPINSLANQDPKCYTKTSDGTYINTYVNKTNNFGGGWYKETEAETIGMNAYVGPGITYSKGINCTSNNWPNCSKPITNYPTTCNNTYDWVKQHIYGGVDLFTNSTATTTTKTVTVCDQPLSQETAPIAGASEFDNLVRGQGRNVSALGSSATAFANNVIKNVGSRNWNNATNRTYLTQIYNTAVSKNVNPVMLLVIWGVEASWRTGYYEFGCKPFTTVFSDQLTCGTNVLNNWMNYFVAHEKNGGYQYTANCYYTDMFSFAYEKYTPVCALNDSNDASRKNFVSFYKVIMGL